MPSPPSPSSACPVCAAQRPATASSTTLVWCRRLSRSHAPVMFPRALPGGGAARRGSPHFFLVSPSPRPCHVIISSIIIPSDRCVGTDAKRRKQRSPYCPPRSGECCLAASALPGDTAAGRANACCTRLRRARTWRKQRMATCARLEAEVRGTREAPPGAAHRRGQWACRWRR